MILTNRFRLFDKKGFNLNPSYSQPIIVELLDTGQGYGAVINPCTNPAGEIDYIEILSGGTNYETTTSVRFTNVDTSYSWSIDSADFTFSPSGEILSISIPVSSNNTGFPYPYNTFFVNQFLEPVLTKKEIS